MTLQVLVSTMHQTDYSLLDKMNIQTDAIVVNQCDKNEIVEFEYKGHKIKWMNLAERGVGLSRNTALMRATGDIILFADDDIVYYDNLEKTVLNEFENHNSELVIFNLKSLTKGKGIKPPKKYKKLCFYNCLRYGGPKIACRRDILLKQNIYFSLLFGGGAKYQAGEDNMFILNCLQKGIKGIVCDKTIGTVEYNTSTWFKGHTEKFYSDKGSLFKAMFGKYAKILYFFFMLKNKHKEYSFFEKLKFGFKGIKNYNEK